ncbi:MAG: Gfo/Idh/MocA family oxidoreductase [Acidobacteria bacterium]|nr:Gfo/Idh/MocA family oxidoreductase [Acidobacteriota bacterium]
MTRRTALAASISAAFAQGSKTNSAVTVGVLGNGNRGTYVAEMLAKNTPGRVVALCDLFPEKMEAAKKRIGVDNPRLYADFRKMLESDIDAIIIATPVFLHAEHFEAAVKSGKHIYIEKPAAGTVADCKKIMQLADRADRKININFGFQRRYAELYLKAKAVADAGDIGSIHMGFARFIKSEGAWNEERRLPPPSTEMGKIVGWNAWKDLNGDLIVENNVHSIDVLNWFLGGRPKSAIGAGGSTKTRQGDNSDHNFVAYEYANGVQGQLLGATLAPARYRDVVEQFFGTKGMLETSENHWRHFRGPGNETFEKSPRNNTIDSVKAFVDRISTGKVENTGVRGAESTLTAILGRMAMQARREVTWDEMMKSA